MIDSLGGRKAFIAVLIVALGVGAVLIKGDIPANFERLLEIIFGTFVLGNVTNTVVAAKTGASDLTTPVDNLADALTDKAAKSIDLSPVTGGLDAIVAQNQAITQALDTSQQGITYLVGYVAQAQQQASQAQQQAAQMQQQALQAQRNRALVSE